METGATQRASSGSGGSAGGMIAAVRGTAPADVWPNLGWVRRRIANARRLFLFLDFDGTLAPIVSVPSMAAMEQEVRTALRAVAKRRDVVITVISGRALDDLQSRVGLPVVYAGNHGLEIHGRGLDYTVPEAQRAKVDLLVACNLLRANLEPIAGALVECKQLTATVHVRQTAPSEKSAVLSTVESVIRRFPRFHVSRGTEAFEIRPNVVWNKGLAARWILAQLDGEACDTITVGDEATDEDMFAELRDGITVRVGFEGSTCARYWMGQSDVARLLNCIRSAAEELRGSI